MKWRLGKNEGEEEKGDESGELEEQPPESLPPALLQRPKPIKEENPPNLMRRRILVGLGIGASLLISGVKGCQIFNQISDYREEERRRKPEIERDYAALRAAKIEVKPEYERTLDRIALTIPNDSRVKKYDDLVAKLPDYTRVVAFTPPGGLDLSKWEKIRGVKQVPTKAMDELMWWAQDVFEHVKMNGEDAFLLSLFYKKNQLPVEFLNTRLNADKLKPAIEQAGLGRAFIVPFACQFGDMTFDRINGVKTALTGPETF